MPRPWAVGPAKAGAQGRGMETASTPDIDEHPSSQMAPHPSSPTPIGDLAPNRKPTHRRPGEGRGPGAGHGNRLNARYRRTPTFPNGPPSVIPDPDRGSRRKPETYTPSPRRRPGPRGGAWKPPQRPISTNTHLLKWPPFRHPRHQPGICCLTPQVPLK